MHVALKNHFKVTWYYVIRNIARIANAVQCHSWLSGNKGCHEFRFSIVRIVVTSVQDCLVSQNTVTVGSIHNSCDVWTHRLWVIVQCFGYFVQQNQPLQQQSESQRRYLHFWCLCSPLIFIKIMINFALYE